MVIALTRSCDYNIWRLGLAVHMQSALPARRRALCGHFRAPWGAMRLLESLANEAVEIDPRSCVAMLGELGA